MRPKENFVAISVNMEETQLKQLNEHTKRNGQTRNGVIRIAVGRYLKNVESYTSENNK